MKKYFYITVGALLFALSVNLFLVPSKIVTGGLTGIATIFYHTFSLPTYITISAGNVLLFTVAWFTLGKHFVFQSIYGMAISTLFVSLTDFLPAMTDDPMLCAIFGGIIMGAGIGLTFINSGTTGGTDVISRIIQHYRPHMSIGTIMMAIDFVIIGISYIVFKDMKLIMYGIISLFVTNAVIDGLIAHLNSGVLVIIVSKDSQKLKKAIINEVERGVTVIEGYGGYSEEKKQILMCVMKKYDLENLKRVTDMNEKDAFMIVTSSKEVLGTGFRYYR